MHNCRVADLGLVPYEDAFALQKREVTRLQQGAAEELLCLVEHPHVITIGRNATGAAITADRRFVEARGVEIVETDRGGDVTYHGPGQLVGYPLLHLEPGRQDIRRYVNDLEEVLIRALSDFGIDSRRHEQHRGVWTGEAKIASLGIRISRWVTSHGFALNVNTDTSYFSLMHPCGIVGCTMATMSELLGHEVDMAEVKERVAANFGDVFERRMIESERDVASAERYAR